MTAHVGREYLDLSPLETRIQTHRLYSETASDVELDVIDAAALAASESLLDIGSGTGSFLGRLRERGHAGRLCALDSSPRAVDVCAAVSGVEATLGDARHLPFTDAEFDVVTARHMLYHVPEPMAALREARRVLRPGGRFVATVNRESANPLMMGLLHDVLTLSGVEEAGSVRDAVVRDIDAEVRSRFARMDGTWRDPKGYVVCSAVL